MQTLPEIKAKKSESTSTAKPYNPERPLLIWTIDCLMCEQSGKRATRVTGGKRPVLCDECRAKYSSAQSANAALNYKLRRKAAKTPKKALK
jgi:hypothetical protein